MDYRVYDMSLFPQLSRILANAATDPKTAYVISLASGKTEKDLLSCLTFRPNGGGYYFNPALLSTTGTLLGTGTDCVRSLVDNLLTFSKCNITCNAVGTPTHVILGGVFPFVFEIGKDVSLLNPESGAAVDVTGEGTVVTISSFGLRLNDVNDMKVGYITQPALSVNGSSGNAYSALADEKLQFIRQINTTDMQIEIASFNATTANGSAGKFLTITSEIGTNNQPVDGITLNMTSYNSTTKMFRLTVSRAPTNNEVFTTKDVLWTKIVVKRVNGVTKVYNDTVEVPLYALSDTAFANPIAYSLVFDLSKIQLARYGVWDTSANGLSFSLGQLTITQL